MGLSGTVIISLGRARDSKPLIIAGESKYLAGGIVMNVSEAAAAAALLSFDIRAAVLSSVRVKYAHKFYPSH